MDRLVAHYLMLYSYCYVKAIELPDSAAGRPKATKADLFDFCFAYFEYNFKL